MELLLNSWILFLIYAVPTFSKQLWNFDLVNVSYYTSDPNMADLALNARRIDRGRYGCSGFIEFKTDLHDNEVRVGVIVQRSLYRSGPYKILPMKVENETLPIIFNIFYKNIIMEDARKCCENCPFFEGFYKGPLTKRRVVLNECTIASDKLPYFMMECYYAVRTTVYGKGWYCYLQTLAYVESEK